MLPSEKLDLIQRRHDEVSARLAEGATGPEFTTLSKELAEIGPLVDLIRDWRMAQSEAEGVALMLEDPALDEEMRGLAEAERELARWHLYDHLVVNADVDRAAHDILAILRAEGLRIPRR